MKNLNLFKSDFSSTFHIAHSLRKTCAFTFAKSQKIAQEIIEKGHAAVLSGSVEELTILQKTFRSKGLKSTIS